MSTDKFFHLYGRLYMQYNLPLNFQQEYHLLVLTKTVKNWSRELWICLLSAKQYYIFAALYHKKDVLCKFQYQVLPLFPKSIASSSLCNHCSTSTVSQAIKSTITQQRITLLITNTVNCPFCNMFFKKNFSRTSN